jgi:uncharacterized protein DUF6680
MDGQIALGLAVVFATLVGPIAAVVVTRYLDDHRARRHRRMEIFRTLMSTRAVVISNDHVRALNLIEVEFHGEAPIEAAWRIYIDHLNAPEGDVKNPGFAAWGQKRVDLLAVLLGKMASGLGIVKGEIEIRRGGYAPDGWGYREQRAGAIQDYVVALSKGEASVPIKVQELPPPPTPDNTVRFPKR